MIKFFTKETSKLFSIGFAIFAMLFGAGNVIYPLALGRDIGNKVWFGLIGFCATAVIIPLIGLIAVMLTDGQYEKFLYKIGSIPGFITTLFCITLLGPLAFTPRCIAISHASVHSYLPECSLFLYSIGTAIIIFLCTLKQNRILDLLGYVLGPIKFSLLFIAIIAGLMYPQELIHISSSSFSALHKGLTAGYWTGDLLGTIFFSGLIYAGIKKNVQDPNNYKQIATIGLKAGIIGATMLGLVYAGFCIVAAFNGTQLQGVADGSIFSFLVPMLLGSFGGLLANVTVALSTLTTAIALTAVSANFFQRYVFRNRIGYPAALTLTIMTSTIMANLGFAGIMKIAGPAIFTIYPALIMLAITSSLQVLVGFSWIKTPVYATFLATLVINYGPFFTQFLP